MGAAGMRFLLEVLELNLLHIQVTDCVELVLIELSSLFLDVSRGLPLLHKAGCILLSCCLRHTKLHNTISNTSFTSNL